MAPQFAQLLLEDFPIEHGLSSLLPRLNDQCLICPAEAEKGLYCAPCRRDIRVVGSHAARRLLDLAETLGSLRDDDLDVTFDVTEVARDLSVEAMRAVALVRNLHILELAVAFGAPEPIIDKLIQNLLSIGNPRTIAEVRSLQPNQESQIVLMHAGLYDFVESRLPRVRHFRALRRHLGMGQLTGSSTKDLAELVKSWALAERGEHWRNKVRSALSFRERPDLRRALLAGSASEDFRAVLNAYLDGAVFLAQEAAELKPGEGLTAYIRRLVQAQAKNVREELDHLRGGGRVLSGDSPAYRDGDEPLWETLPAPHDDDYDLHEAIEKFVVTAGLTPRQREVLRLRLEGYAESEIAAHLGISQPRVSQLMQAIMRKASARLAR